MASTNRICMARRPVGVPHADDFRIERTLLPQLTAGHVLVELQWISLDPYIRLRMAGRHLVDNLSPGDAINSEVIGRVVETAEPSLQVNDLVIGFSDWQSQAVLRADDLKKLPSTDHSKSYYLGVLGMPGLTAYAGVEALLQPSAGDVVVVSAAAGPVGSSVGQLAKARGAMVIGIAGGREKCRWVVEQAGFDHSIDYRHEDVRSRLGDICPTGPSHYFDNVGGDMLRLMLECMRPYGKIALCGVISDYNETDPALGPTSLEIITARATIMGLVVYDFEHLQNEARAAIGKLIKANSFAVREDISEGLEKAPQAFARLMRGENQGKALVRLCS